MSDIYIKAHGLSKDYKVKTESGGHKLIPILEEVSFEIQRGEVLGIIGANGSGKSTLLKLIAGVTKPNAGQVEVNGTVASLLDIGAGFHPDLSGEENIYLMGQLQGISKKISKQFVDEIIAFSEIGEFIHLPVKNYSKGMYLRLAFSTMIHLPFDIYLMDEVLSVGDIEFQEKCKKYIRNLAIGKDKILLIISHNYSELKDLCTRYFTLENQSVLDFPSLDAYFAHQATRTKKPKDGSYQLWEQGLSARKPLENAAVNFRKESAVFHFDEYVSLEIELTNVTENVQLGLSLRDGFNQTVFQTYFSEKIRPSSSVLLDVILPKQFFNQGSFPIDLLFYSNGQLHCIWNDCGVFQIVEVQHPKTLSLRTWGPTKPDIQIQSIAYVD
jgi:ABC-type polysaccharide/polyol phosphate transport system ATPase subunit